MSPQAADLAFGDIDLDAAEALMAYLATGGAAPQRQPDGSTLTGLPEDILAMLQAADAAGTPAVDGDAIDDLQRLLAGIEEVVTAAAEVGSEGASELGDVVDEAQRLLRLAGDAATEGGSVDVTAAPSPEAPTSASGDAEAIPSATPADAPAVDVTPDRQPAARADGAAVTADVAQDARPLTQPQGAEVAGAASMASAVTEAAGPRIQSVEAARVVNAASLPAEVADTVRLAAMRGDSEVRLVLNPPELGHLDIRLVSGDSGLRITIEASQAGARELLDRSLAGLQQALESRDLRVDRLEVRASDAGRGSLDTSGGGHQPGGGSSGSSDGDGQPDWSPVAAIEGVMAASDSPTPSTQADAVIDGSVDVLA